MRDISGAEFKMAKTLSLKFFGSGMVDLGPGVMKRVKNSRKMQMVFFVHYGRVTVEVGTPSTSFSIGKGGTWQVPRGKFNRCLTRFKKPRIPGRRRPGIVPCFNPLSTQVFILVTKSAALFEFWVFLGPNPPTSTSKGRWARCYYFCYLPSSTSNKH